MGSCAKVLYLGFTIAVGLPVPLLALQIIFLNLMSDGCPAVALSQEPAEATIMKATRFVIPHINALPYRHMPSNNEIPVCQTP